MEWQHEVVEEVRRGLSPTLCSGERPGLWQQPFVWLGWAHHTQGQSGYCLFGKSYNILLQLFMEENSWCFWKRLGVGAGRQEGEPSRVPSTPNLRGSDAVTHASMFGWWGRRNSEHPPCWFRVREDLSPCSTSGCWEPAPLTSGSALWVSAQPCLPLQGSALVALALLFIYLLLRLGLSILLVEP